MPQCIFCDNELDATTKPEHILADALGGRMKTREADCSDCNNYFGGSIDKALTSQVEVIRNLLQLRSGSGDAPPGLRNIMAGSEKINIGNDGRPKLKAPPFVFTELPDGNVDVKIQVESEEELLRYLPHLAARLRITEDEVKQLVLGGGASNTERRPGGIHHHISLGGEDELRSAAKSCLVLLATKVGTAPLKSDAFADAREFVTTGSETFYKTSVFLDPRELPYAAQLAAQFGEFFNLIHVQSDGNGRVIGHFTLYNMVGWQIILAEKDGPKDVKVTLVSNPLNPSNWSGRLSVDVPFDFLNTVDNSDRLTRARERLIAMSQRHVDQSRETEIGRIVDSVCARYGVVGDDTPIDASYVGDIMAEAFARVGAHAMNLPHEEKISPARLKQLLGIADPETPDET